MSINEATNSVELEFYKWFNSKENLDKGPWIPPSTKFEALLEGFVAGWEANEKARALVFKLPEGYLDEDEEK